MSQSLVVSSDELTSFVEKLLMAVGTPPAEAHIVAAALVDADIEGLPSHGMMLLPMYLDRIAAGSVNPAARGKIVSDTGTQIVLDGENGLGHVLAEQAVKLVVERAQTKGMAVVAIRNAFHFGAAGRFAREIALHGCAGIVMANTRPLLPAPGGAERIVGNNPLAIAVPTTEEPIVLDLALSAGAMGKIRLAESQRRPIPEGWAATDEGVPTTDPAAAIKGMLLPAAGAKGFGLAVMIDLLAGGLSSGAIGDAVQPLFGDMSKPYGCSNLFVAIDIAGFRPLDEFAEQASKFGKKVRSSRRAPGAGDIRMPGDRASKAHRMFSGDLLIAASTAAALRDAARRLDVPIPQQLNA
jgi:LDH2 family malate/lactate/ureidoglycolate dehydrogenase